MSGRTQRIFDESGARRMTPEEFVDALSDVAHTQVIGMEGRGLGTDEHQIVSIGLELSDGRFIEITAVTDLKDRPELIISELDPNA